MHDPKTANRVKKIRAIWNSEATDVEAPESLAAAAYLRPLHSPDGVLKLMGRNPPAKLLCKAVALVATLVDYKSLLCLMAYADEPKATAVDVTTSDATAPEH